MSDKEKFDFAKKDEEKSSEDCEAKEEGSEEVSSEVSEDKKNVDHFAPHLDHPQIKSGYPGTKITGKK